eukprot:4254264-Pleurochrysis_carterae.AAC.3
MTASLWAPPKRRVRASARARTRTQARAQGRRYSDTCAPILNRTSARALAPTYAYVRAHAHAHALAQAHALALARVCLRTCADACTNARLPIHRSGACVLGFGTARSAWYLCESVQGQPALLQRDHRRPLLLAI